MIKRSCLIVDNEDQTEEIEKLVRDAEHTGIQLECKQFSVGNTGYSDILTDGLIDISKVVIEYKKRFNNHYFNLIAFDWDLEDENITGVELIRQFTSNRIALFSPKMVYSGVLDDIIKRIVQDNLYLGTTGKTSRPILKDAAVTKIKSLVKNRVFEYLDRDHRDPMILKFLKENMQSTELVIAQTLKKFPELKFNNRFINPNFKGKTFEEIAVILESDEIQGNEFKREIIEQVLAYLTESL